MRAGSICSGAGGLDLAIEAVFGAETVWQAEVDPHASEVLAHRWPGVPNLGDITAVDWSSVEPVDVLSGGTPCQDMSSAGRRAGMRGGTRSGLWSHMAEAIDIIRPTVVVWENVRGALSAGADSNVESEPGLLGGAGATVHPLRAAGRVLGDLADLGYDAAWRVVAASGLGACHRRDRLFILAVATDAGRSRCIAWSAKDRVRPHRKGDLLADRQASGSWDSRGAGPGVPVATDAGSPRLGELAGGAPTEETGPEGRNGTDDLPTVAIDPARWGRYAAAIARHEAAFGRPAPDPTETSAKGNPVLSARFTEWMMGWPDGWVTDLLPRRPALRACGNGVVPAQAAAAIRSLLPALLEAGPS